MPRKRRMVLAGAVASATASFATPAAAEPAQCRVIELGMTPTEGLQMVAWIESTSGQYVDTVFITHKTGQYGLGNRPGIMQFNSGKRWPYGPRTTALPVWAHKHGLTFPLVFFQNGDGVDDGTAFDNDRNLSHPFTQSSVESLYFRPLRPSEPGWDTGSTASFAYTDKGKLHETLTSRYPPRSDVVRQAGLDHPAVEMFKAMNPFDEVSVATPAGSAPFAVRWSMPPALAPGDYVLMLEASKEFDFNASYRQGTAAAMWQDATFPPPSNLQWNDYGVPYRGQPSVVYRVPFTIGTSRTVAFTDAYAGYSDPTGESGGIRPPDATIETIVPGSGAARLQLVPDDEGGPLHRLKVVARPEQDEVFPGNISSSEVIDVDHRSVEVTFVAPGDDGAVGRITSYEVRYRAGAPMTVEDFANATPVSTSVDPVDAGGMQTVRIDGLLPRTDYSVGIVAYDDCRNASALAVVSFTTADREVGEVDACFVATAAWGSAMANDVAMLRHMRDAVLRKTIVGELAVEAYYTFGPALAGVIGESELLRATARASLEPLVSWARSWARSWPFSLGND